MEKLYRRLVPITPQDEMHLQVDHYLEPVDFDHQLNDLVKMFDGLLKDVSRLHSGNATHQKIHLQAALHFHRDELIKEQEDVFTQEQNNANAQLRATAPEMLERLEYVVSWLEDTKVHADIVRHCKSTIKKATE